jgi:ribosomal protein S18 acetylase RimI-like enzyme
MIIRNLELSDISELSKLHKNIFGKTHFSSTFSLPLLEKYFYELLAHNQYKFVSIENEKITGYLIAGKNVDEPVNKFFKKNIFQIFITLMLNPIFIIEKILYFILKFAWKKENVHCNHVSVYLIAVDSRIQNKGIGKRLLKFFEDDLIKYKIFNYTLAVRKNNKNAIEFYQKNNFSVIESDFKSISFIKYL